jgi:tungstate transport system permease protein
MLKSKSERMQSIASRCSGLEAERSQDSQPPILNCAQTRYGLGRGPCERNTGNRLKKPVQQQPVIRVYPFLKARLSTPSVRIGAQTMHTFSDSVISAYLLISSFDPLLWSVVARSLAVSASACALAYSLGVVLGAWLAVSRFTGRGAVLLVLNTLLALPSVVVGLVVYLLLSRTGPLGFLGWLFSFKAMVLAQCVLVLPVVTALTRQLVEDVELQHGEQWASLGAGPWLRGLLLAWDERMALLMIAVAAFGRAISEVGAVMIVGGNIDGFTRVMTTAIALETSKGDLPLALALGLMLLAVVGVLNLAIAGLRQWAEKRQDILVVAPKGWVA